MRFTPFSFSTPYLSPPRTSRAYSPRSNAGESHRSSNTKKEMFYNKTLIKFKMHDPNAFSLCLPCDGRLSP